MNRIKTIIIFLLFFLFSITLSSCHPTTESLLLSKKDYYDYFDTTIYIKIWDENQITDIQWNEIENILKDIQFTFKRTEPEDYESESELHKLNASAGLETPFKTSDDLYEVIKMGIEFARETNGKFEPTIGPLVDLWEINNPEKSHPAPSEQAIINLLPIINYELIEINDEEQAIYLPQQGMIIDLGAIAKGYAADKLVEYFKTQNIEHAMISLGGNIYAYGDRHSKQSDGSYNWSIGIQDPRLGESGSIATLYLKNKTIVTSGIYERYIIDPETNIMYHHILDPHIGYPVDNNLASVTIITDSSATADALSTSTFALGLADGIKFIESYPNTEAVFITKTNKVYITSGMKDLYDFQIKNNDFSYVD